MWLATVLSKLSTKWFLNATFNYGIHLIVSVGISRPQIALQITTCIDHYGLITKNGGGEGEREGGKEGGRGGGRREEGEGEREGGGRRGRGK